MESLLNQAATAAKIEPLSTLQIACPTSDTPYEYLASLRRSMRLFANFSERVSRGSGLSAIEYQALLAIRTRSPPGPTRNALCRDLHVKWNAAEALMKRLEHIRLIRVEADAADRRFKRLVLTSRGEAVLSRLAARHLEELRRHVASVVRVLKVLSGPADDCPDSSAALSQIL
jgi:DNA-binding MarR family transcriptional regulator